MRTETDRAYMAGFVDGEGHIGIGLLSTNTGRKRHTLNVTVTNTHIEALNELSEIWGPKVVNLRQRQDNWRPTGDIKWNTGAAAEMLRELQPYLRIKKEQCRIALEYAETINRPRFHAKYVEQDVWEERERLRLEIRALNSRRPAEPVKFEKMPELNCQYCGESFGSYQQRRKYCSQKCSMQAGREAYIDRHTYQRTCPACQNEFTARLKQNYCSIRCSSRHAHTRRDYKKTVMAT